MLPLELALADKRNEFRELIAHLDAAAHALLRMSSDAPPNAEVASFAASIVRMFLQLDERLTEGQWHQADALLRLVLAHMPKDREALLGRITVADALQRPDVALDYAREMARTHPSDETAKRRLAKMAWKAGKPEDGLRVLMGCVEQRPVDAALLLNIARGLKANGNHEACAKALRRLLAQNPEHEPAKELLEDVVALLGGESSTEPEPSPDLNDPEQMCRLVETYAAEGRLEYAIDILKAALGPGKISFAYVRRCCELIAEADAKTGAKAWSLSTARFPKNRLAWVRLSDAVFVDGGVDAGVQVIADAYLHLPDDPVLRAKHANLLVRGKRFTAAKDLYEQMIASDPSDLAAREAYGRLLFNMGDLNKADQVFASVLSDAPDNVSAMLGRVDIAAGRGETEAAFSILEDKLFSSD